MIDPNLEAIAVEFVAVAFAAIVIVGFLTFMLLRAARLEAPAMVTLALSIVTILALAVYAFTREEVMATLVGTGLGALAGAVTSQLADPNRRKAAVMTEQPNDTVDEPVDANIPVDEPHGGEEFDAPEAEVHDEEATEASIHGTEEDQ